MRPRADLALSSDRGAYEGFKAVVGPSHEPVFCPYLSLDCNTHQFTSQMSIVFRPLLNAIMS
jgi:hypothetical protein